MNRYNSLKGTREVSGPGVGRKEGCRSECLEISVEEPAKGKTATAKDFFTIP